MRPPELSVTKISRPPRYDRFGNPPCGEKPLIYLGFSRVVKFLLSDLLDWVLAYFNPF